MYRVCRVPQTIKNCSRKPLVTLSKVEGRGSSLCLRVLAVNETRGWRRLSRFPVMHEYMMTPSRDFHATINLNLPVSLPETSGCHRFVQLKGRTKMMNNILKLYRPLSHVTYVRNRFGST